MIGIFQWKILWKIMHYVIGTPEQIFRFNVWIWTILHAISSAMNNVPQEAWNWMPGLQKVNAPWQSFYSSSNPYHIYLIPERWIFSQFFMDEALKLALSFGRFHISDIIFALNPKEPSWIFLTYFGKNTCPAMLISLFITCTHFGPVSSQQESLPLLVMSAPTAATEIGWQLSEISRANSVMTCAGSRELP